MTLGMHMESQLFTSAFTRSAHGSLVAVQAMDYAVETFGQSRSQLTASAFHSNYIINV